MVDTSAHLLGGDVYHYQSKLTAKEPEVGGAWEWHQDYGYWYYNGCLRPDLLSVMIALDKTDRENGCLQIASGSHRLGRIDHTPLSPTQNEVDPKRMPYILEQCPIEYCELEPGDALIFHCNAIHRSDANRSAKRRWTLLICYNRVDNDTFVKSDDRYFVPLDKVDDGALRRAGAALRQRRQPGTLRVAGPTCRTCARLRKTPWTSGERPHRTSTRSSPSSKPSASSTRSSSRPSGARPTTPRQSRQAFFTKLLVAPDIYFLVSTEGRQILGFLIARKFPAPPVYTPGGDTWLVDDFAVSANRVIGSPLAKRCCATSRPCCTSMARRRSSPSAPSATSPRPRCCGASI